MAISDQAFNFIATMSDNKFLGKYRNGTTRLRWWDYGSNAHYFITICVKGKEHPFGKINPSGLQPTEIGRIASQYWSDIPVHMPFIRLDEFILMPDHLHGILTIEKTDKTDWKANEFAPQSKNIPSVIRGYKAAVKKYAVMNKIDFAWQSRYYDRIIRDEIELENVRQYIRSNPDRWLKKQAAP
jgi:putative transposase